MLFPLWLALALVLLGARAAPAAPAEPDPTEDACLQDSECLSHYQSARQLSKAGQSPAAIEEYQRAYQRLPVPRLMYSIARLQHRLGQSQAALASYQRFLATAAPGDEDLRAKAQEYRTQLERERLAAAPAPGSEGTSAPALAAPAAAAPTAAPAAPAPRQPLYKKWWLWTLVGVAAAGAVTATVVATYPREPTVPTGAQSYSPMF